MGNPKNPREGDKMADSTGLSKKKAALPGQETIAGSNAPGTRQAHFPTFEGSHPCGLGSKVARPVRQVRAFSLFANDEPRTFRQARATPARERRSLTAESSIADRRYISVRRERRYKSCRSVWLKADS
jgi:hypothetical protein